MENALSLWSHWMLAVSVQLAILVTLIAIVLYFGKRFSARFRYTIWLLVLLKALTPPYLATPWSLGGFFDRSGETAAVTEMETVTIPPMSRVNFDEEFHGERASSGASVVSAREYTLNEVHQEMRQGISFSQGIFLVWSFGVTGFWCVVVFCYLRALRVLCKGKELHRGPIFELLTQLAGELNLRNVPRIVLSDAVKSPFLCGFFRGTIAIPADFPGEVSPVEMESVLLHELTHWKRGDMFVTRIELLVRGLFWFHPLVHYSLHRLRDERESACDEAVLASGAVAARQYGSSLVSVLLASRERSLVPVGFLGFLGILERNTQLQQRLEEIMSQENRVKRIGLRGWCILLFFLIGVFPMAAMPQTPSPPQASQQSEDAFEKRISAEELASLRKGYEKALSEFNGDISSATFETIVQLHGSAQSYCAALHEEGRIEEAKEILMKIKDWNEGILKNAETMQNADEKEETLHYISGSYSLFALFGMYDEAVKAAKMSITERQYNAAEYLTNLARMVARREGFVRAIPILEEALVAAKKLPSTFWRELAIIEIAEVYAEVGREVEARMLLLTLTEEGRARGTLMLYRTAKRNERPESFLANLLQEAEKAAALADREVDEEMVEHGEMDHTYRIALELAGSGEIDKATALFEKTLSAKIPYYRDEFQERIGYYLNDQNRFAEAEKCVDKIESATTKANLLTSILRQAKQTESPETLKRLIEKAEPFVDKMGPKAHRIGNQLRLAAYRMRIGEVERGRKRIDELVETPIESEPSLTRNWRISRAVSALAIAGLYDEAEKRIAMFEDDSWITRDMHVSDAYRSLNSLRRFEEHPELWKEEMKKQHLSEKDDR